MYCRRPEGTMDGEDQPFGVPVSDSVVYCVEDINFTLCVCLCLATSCKVH